MRSNFALIVRFEQITPSVGEPSGLNYETHFEGGEVTLSSRCTDIQTSTLTHNPTDRTHNSGPAGAVKPLPLQLPSKGGAIQGCG